MAHSRPVVTPRPEAAIQYISLNIVPEDIDVNQSYSLVQVNFRNPLLSLSFLIAADFSVAAPKTTAKAKTPYRNHIIALFAFLLLTEASNDIQIAPMTVIMESIICKNYYGDTNTINSTTSTTLDLADFSSSWAAADDRRCKIEPVQSELAHMWKESGTGAGDVRVDTGEGVDSSSLLVARSIAIANQLAICIFSSNWWWKPYSGVSNLYDNDRSHSSRTSYVSKKFDWDISEASLLTSYRAALNLILSLVLLPLASHLFRTRLHMATEVKDLWLTRFSASVLCLGSALMALAPNLFFLVSGLTIFAHGYGLSALIHSLAASVVEPRHIVILYNAMHMGTYPYLLLAPRDVESSLDTLTSDIWVLKYVLPIYMA
ncbi:hypothetical protein TWF679_008921 [Orbilia oligospora]|uniref:Uncharacterized protein n=1 Tax=Orbilia oligospora TaxID=2813651 RepID=A0A8H8VJV9_ORBOL|nr:hypothetical protein TWF679_008921 [Orbilia oligospora]